MKANWRERVAVSLRQSKNVDGVAKLEDIIANVVPSKEGMNPKSLNSVVWSTLRDPYFEKVGRAMYRIAGTSPISEAMTTPAVVVEAFMTDGKLHDLTRAPLVVGDEETFYVDGREYKEPITVSVPEPRSLALADEEEDF